MRKGYKKKKTIKNAFELFEDTEQVYDGFNKKLFLLAPTEVRGMSAYAANNRVFEGSHLKILTLK